MIRGLLLNHRVTKCTGVHGEVFVCSVVIS